MSQTLKQYHVPKRVVILGTGYAGVNAYLSLYKNLGHRKDVEVTVISNVDHFLYATMLYEIPAGNLPPSGIRESFRSIMKKDFGSFVQGEVKWIDFDNQTVQYKAETTLPHADEGSAYQTISYDYLVSALGSKANFFGISGVEEHSYVLKTLEDAKRMKNAVLERFEEATLMSNEEEIRKNLSFVVIGGGPTGVTMATKLADLLNEEMKECFPELIRYVSLSLIEGSDRLFSKEDPWFHEKTLPVLKKKSIHVHLGEYVKEVSLDGVSCVTCFVPGKFVIWTAGVAAIEIDTAAIKGIERDERTRRIKVNDFLQLGAYPNVFVLGDQADLKSEQLGYSYPMKAQFAVRQGKLVGENIAQILHNGTLKKFAEKDKGFIISLGHGSTLADFMGMKFAGPIATFMYRFVYVINTITIRAKLRAMGEWFINTFSNRDISRL